MQVNSPPIPGSPAISTYRDPGNTDVPPGITTSGVPAQKLTVKEIQTQDKDAPSEESNLNLACIGNCAYSALIDEKGTVVWSCFPRFDGDPIFCSLLKKSTSGTGSIGFFDIQMTQLENSEQHYMGNTGVLRTTLHGPDGILEIIDFAPRFESFEREYRPTMFIRMLTPLKGRPRARIRLRPTFGYGWGAPEKTRGSNHIRYLLSNNTIRLTTNAPIAYIVDEVLFEIDEPLYLILMPDESLKVPLNEMTQSYLQKTLAFWTRWTETLSVPLEWQQEYIRACITLKMSSYEETGAIIAAMTTSIPSIPNGLKHDLRYCWLRDAMYTTRILNRIGATTMMERYLKYLTNFVADFTAAQEGETERRIQSVYGISLETRLHPREMHRLPGYRGMGPVIIGTEDAETIQNDVYGSVILALTQVYFDKRLVTQGDLVLFEKLQVLGEMAAKLAYKPDYGPKGRQTHMERHTYSVAMCWAACDRLAKISWKLKQADRAKYWLQHADKIHEDIMKNAWNEELNSLVSRVNTKVVDSYLLLLPELGFIDANDPKFVATVAHIEKTVLREDKFIVSASNTDVVKNNGTFWYIKILALQGHKDKARQLFENMLKHLNNAGIISETMFLRTQELWGNFPHNNALVGLIDCALTLSEDWSNLHSTRFSMKEMKSQPQK